MESQVQKAMDRLELIRLAMAGQIAKEQELEAQLFYDQIGEVWTMLNDSIPA